jgi:hypothetical protein
MTGCLTELTAIATAHRVRCARLPARCNPLAADAAVTSRTTRSRESDETERSPVRELADSDMRHDFAVTADWR